MPARSIKTPIAPGGGVTTGPIISGPAWTDEVAWLNIRGLYAVDLASGTLVYTWP
jgi:hypothetical protein